MVQARCRLVHGLYGQPRMIHMHPVASLDSRSLCHTFPTTLWLPSSPPLVDIQVDSGTKLCPVSQISPFLCMPQSVPPVLSLLPCVPSSGTPVCRSWWSGVECGEEGGRQAGLKRGCSIVPTQSIHPPLICRSLGHLGVVGTKAKDAKRWNYERRVDAHTQLLM